VRKTLVALTAALALTITGGATAATGNALGKKTGKHATGSSLGHKIGKHAH
jgi:hypothetical protein